MGDRQIREGSPVTWPWGSGKGQGDVKEIHRGDITRTINGTDVTRHGSDDNPAYLIKTDDSKVLKLRSEPDQGSRPAHGSPGVNFLSDPDIRQ